MSRIPALPRLRDWKRGDKFEAAHWQEPVSAIKTIMQSMAATPPAMPFPGREMWVGKVVAKGPNGEAAPAGAQYWVQKQTINGDKPTAKLAFSEDKSDQALDAQLSTGGTTVKTPNIFSVTNLPEWVSGGDGSHLLAVGAMVLVFAWWDSGSHNGQGSSSTSSSSDPILSNKRYMCTSLPSAYIEFRVALTQTGGSGTAGWTYTAKTMDGSVTLGTGLSPEMPHWGNTTAATGGMGYYDNTGTFVLSIAFEGRGTGTC